MGVELEERKLQTDCSKAGSETGAVVLEDGKGSKNRLPDCIPVWPLGSQVECVSSYGWLIQKNGSRLEGGAESLQEGERLVRRQDLSVRGDRRESGNHLPEFQPGVATALYLYIFVFIFHFPKSLYRPNYM